MTCRENNSSELLTRRLFYYIPFLVTKISLIYFINLISLINIKILKMYMYLLITAKNDEPITKEKTKNSSFQERRLALKSRNDLSTIVCYEPSTHLPDDEIFSSAKSNSDFVCSVGLDVFIKSHRIIK